MFENLIIPNGVYHRRYGKLLGYHSSIKELMLLIPNVNSYNGHLINALKYDVYNFIETARSLAIILCEHNGYSCGYNYNVPSIINLYIDGLVAKEDITCLIDLSELRRNAILDVWEDDLFIGNVELATDNFEKLVVLFTNVSDKAQIVESSSVEEDEEEEF